MKLNLSLGNRRRWTVQWTLKESLSQMPGLNWYDGFQITQFSGISVKHHKCFQKVAFKLLLHTVVKETRTFLFLSQQYSAFWRSKTELRFFFFCMKMSKNHKIFCWYPALLLKHTIRYITIYIPISIFISSPYFLFQSNQIVAIRIVLRNSISIWNFIWNCIVDR